MPDLESTIHLDMLNHAKSANFYGKEIYGLQWGDPDKDQNLIVVKEKYLEPYIDPNKVCVEIGVGGGRWTRYLLGFKTLYAVDYHSELLDVLKTNFTNDNLVFIKTNGTDFPGIPLRSVDFVWTFGTFVHLEQKLIREYLANMQSILKDDGKICIQYSDKDKALAKENKGFSHNNARIMCNLVMNAGFIIFDEDLVTLPHSSIICFRKQ